jgi:hypothetical protein
MLPNEPQKAIAFVFPLIREQAWLLSLAQNDCCGPQSF